MVWEEGEDGEADDDVLNLQIILCLHFAVTCDILHDLFAIFAHFVLVFVLVEYPIQLVLLLVHHTIMLFHLAFLHVLKIIIAEYLLTEIVDHAILLHFSLVVLKIL